LILRGLELREQGIQKIAKRASSVAYAEAGDGVEFGHRLVEIGEEEEGIVAKAAGASRGSQDLSFNYAVRYGDLLRFGKPGMCAQSR
jgi:hypothetical protein